MIEADDQADRIIATLNETQAVHARSLIALKILTDCCLMYGSSIGVLLKRDSEKGIFKYAVHRLLTFGNEHRAASGQLWKKQVRINDQAAYLLVAVCVRSAEGRKRVIQEMFEGLKGDRGSLAAPQGGKRQATFALVDFMNSLLSAGTRGYGPGGAEPSSNELKI